MTRFRAELEENCLVGGDKKGVRLEDTANRISMLLYYCAGRLGLVVKGKVWMLAV
jgi:hypothetical protein